MGRRALGREAPGRKGPGPWTFDPDRCFSPERSQRDLHLFAGTPTGLWPKRQLIELFGLDERPDAAVAPALARALAYDQARDTYRLAASARGAP